MTYAVLVAATMMLSQNPAAARAESTEADRQDVAVTAYNNGLALVRDQRALTLPTGEIDLVFGDVAERIKAQTVGLRSLAEEGSAIIFEQNYEFDLISPDKLMEKYVGKEVRLINFSKDIGFEEVSATLLSTNGGPVYNVNGSIHLGHPGTVVLPEIPENLIAKPSLIWRLDNGRADQVLEITYLTEGMSWQADYVVTLAKDDKSLDVAGWVTLNNQTGASFTDAKLKLVAGDVNLAQPEMAVKRMRAASMEMDMMGAPMPEQEAFAEFHLYSMPRRTTIKQNQSKQLALLSGEGVASEKRYEFRGQLHYFSQRMEALRDQHVDVFLEFMNEEGNGLGIPLPAGVMRIYQEDSEGMLQFAGEDRIKHTPKNEKVRLRMGSAFDVVADRIQTDYSVIAQNIFESSYEITVRNHKESGITVDVVEPMPSDWTILESSHPHEKRDAQTAVFSVPVEADGEVTVTYRVRVRY